MLAVISPSLPVLEEIKNPWSLLKTRPVENGQSPTAIAHRRMSVDVDSTNASCSRVTR
jgi:hypothetical protein